MASLLAEVGIFTSRGGLDASIDNHVFRAYYTLTTSFLLVSAGILVTSQFFGDPIDCILSGSTLRSEHEQEAIDTFCWVSATYTLEYIPGTINPGPHILDDRGIGTFSPNYHTKRFQLYYRWTPIIFLVQALLFYFPHYLWKNWEGGKMAGLSAKPKLNVPVDPRLENDVRVTRIKLLVSHLEQYDINSNNWYTYRFYLCEALNLVVLLVNVWMLEWVTEGLFRQLGSELLREGVSSRHLLRLFPNEAKCMWVTTGPSGSRQEQDALCVLPLNTFNKGVFLVLWFWYPLLGIVTACWLLFRLPTMFPAMRSWLLEFKACPVHKETHSHGDRTCIDQVANLLPHPDWYILLQLAENVDSVAIKDIIERLCERLTDKEGKKPEAKRNNFKRHSLFEECLPQYEKLSPKAK